MRFLEESIATLISGQKGKAFNGRRYSWIQEEEQLFTGAARLYAVKGKNDGVAVKGSEGRTCNVVEHGRDRIDILSPNRHQQLCLLPRV